MQDSIITEASAELRSMDNQATSMTFILLVYDIDLLLCTLILLLGDWWGLIYPYSSRSSFHYHGLTDLYQTTTKRIKSQAVWDPFH